MASDEEFRYRIPSWRSATIVPIALIAGDVLLMLFFPRQRDLPLILPFLVAGGWIVWIVAALPSLRVTSAEVTSYNTWFVQRIPLAVIESVTGGARLTIKTRDGRTHIPAAIMPNGVFFFNSARRAAAYGSDLMPVRRFEDVRRDEERERTPATVIAQVIRQRVENLPPEATRTPSATPAPVANLLAVYGTLIVCAACAAFFFIML